MKTYLLSDEQVSQLQALNMPNVQFIPCSNEQGAIEVKENEFDAPEFSLHKALLDSWNLSDITADWDGFNAAMLADPAFNTYYGVVLQTAPAVPPSVQAALTQVESHGLSGFGMVFSLFCTIANVKQSDRERWGNWAVDSRLHPEFVAIIRGS
jgi:hypothetical protein